MLFKEFGDKKKPAIILLHGGGLSYWSLQSHIDDLQKDYYVVCPIIDGHGEDYATEFVSIDDSADKVIAFINKELGGKAFALAGLSIGAQIVVSVLSKAPDIAKKAIIESALVYPMKITNSMVNMTYNMSFGLIKKKWFAKMQAKVLFVPDNLFEKYYEQSSAMSKRNLIEMSKSNSDFPLPKGIADTSADALIIVGEKELGIMKKSAKLLDDTIKCSTLNIISGNGHGEISLKTPDKYIEMLKIFFKS